MLPTQSFPSHHERGRVFQRRARAGRLPHQAVLARFRVRHSGAKSFRRSFRLTSVFCSTRLPSLASHPPALTLPKWPAFSHYLLLLVQRTRRIYFALSAQVRTSRDGHTGSTATTRHKDSASPLLPPSQASSLPKNGVNRRINAWNTMTTVPTAACSTRASKQGARREPTPRVPSPAFSTNAAGPAPLLHPDTRLVRARRPLARARSPSP